MRLITLSEDHADAIEELAQEFYPPEFHLDIEDVAKNLRLADEEGFNLSFGLESGGTLAGYLLAWLDHSRLEGRVEDVVLIDDLVLIPQAQTYLKKILSALVEEISSKELGDLAVEAAVRAGDKSFFAANRRFLESLGYEMVAEVPYEDEDLAEELTWVRFEPWSRKEFEAAPDDFFERINSADGGDVNHPSLAEEEEDFGDFEEGLH